MFCQACLHEDWHALRMAGYCTLYFIVAALPCSEMSGEKNLEQKSLDSTNQVTEPNRNTNLALLIKML